MLLKYESQRDWELMLPPPPKIFHFENKASNKPGYKEVISIESGTVEWFTGFKE